jgi:hypothetical protein
MTDTLTYVPDEEQVAADGFTKLVDRLSRQSITPGKHFDAFNDVPWDDADFLIDPADPRWEVSLDNPLSSTAWFQAQPPEVRSRISLHLVAEKMKTGLQFESVLKRGLLEFAMKLPNGSPEFRYAYHEVIEEAQHSLMFQGFVNRSGLEIKGMPKLLEFGSRRVVALGRRFPALFFLFVLGGEDPIDYVQRSSLRRGVEIHPLLERIMRIHVTEEARHLSFARHWLKLRVPALNRVNRAWLAIETPMILSSMAPLMLRPSSHMIRTYGIPKDALDEAYKTPAAKEHQLAALRKVRTLCVDLGIVTRWSKPLWKALGIWEEPSAATAPATAQTSAA